MTSFLRRRNDDTYLDGFDVSTRIVSSCSSSTWEELVLDSMVKELIRAGAMDLLEGTRAQLMAAVEGAIESGARTLRDRLSGQEGLFGGSLEAEEDHSARPLPAASQKQDARCTRLPRSPATPA